MEIVEVMEVQIDTDNTKTADKDEDQITSPSSPIISSVIKDIMY